jgi:APA family basic amino acid/polyamine antiporter
MWGYPLVPVLFVITSSALLYYTFTENLRNSGLGVLVILAGIPIFLYFSRRRGEAASS